MKRKAVVSIVLAAALLAACSSSQTGKTGSAASSAASVTETAAEETEETAIEDTAESAVSQSTETESTAAADTGSDTNMNVSMQTSNEYSSVIPAVSDYFTETPYENVESDAGLAVMWDTCNMDEVHAFVTALKDKGFTMNPSEISTGTLYQYAATSSDGVYYLVLTCDAGTTDPYMSLDVTKN